MNQIHGFFVNKLNIEKYLHLERAGRKTRIISIIVMIAVAAFVAIHYDLYLNPELELNNGMTLFIISLLFGPLFCVLINFKPHVDENYRNITNSIAFVIEPILAMIMVECFNGNLVFNYGLKRVVAHYILYFSLYLFFYVIIGRYHMAGMIMNIGLYIWALVNYFVHLFRGTPFIPSDILSFKTGMDVADGYTYSLSWELILGTLLFALCIMFNHYVNNLKFKKHHVKLITRIGGIAYLFVISGFFFLTDFPASFGLKPDFWDQSRGYKNHGSFFDFCLNTQYLVVKKPSGYNSAELEDELYQVLEDYGVDPDGQTSINILTGKNDYVPKDGELPNIICIMNESWTDFESIGDITLNNDNMPYIHSLTEDTVKGNLSVSVFGAGTSNSEFEFLSGDSIFFLPSGCNVYQSYLKSEVPSLVSTVGDLGYSKLAYHPYYGQGWNREIVYPLLGFDDYISIEDFVAADIIKTYRDNNNVAEYEQLLHERYPTEDMLLRRFISDSYDVDMIIDFYKNRDVSKPFFLFNVTMQNHGGYKVSYPNFYQMIYATSTEKTYQMANRYFSLIPHTDAAFKQLVNYFSLIDEPTIICMFGDHQPAIETSFYEEFYGVDKLEDLTIEQNQNRHITPFVIWANYDIPEATVNHMSANYLSTLVEQLAGLPMTDYNKFLAAMYQDVPVTNAIGVIDSEGNYYEPDSNTPYDDVLHCYKRLEYNSLIDSANRKQPLFRLK